MSKNSHKALYEQLMTWLPTLNSQRKKRVKPQAKTRFRKPNR